MRGATNNQGNMSLPSSPNSHLGLPPPLQRSHSKSPSQQAASLAAARAPPSVAADQDNGTGKNRRSAVKKPAVAPKPRRLSSYQRQDVKTDEDEPTDSTSIAPTTSLVDLFERKASSSQIPGKRPEPVVIKPSDDLPIKSPKPIRTSGGGITSMFQLELEDRESAPQKEAKDVKPETSTATIERPSIASSSPHDSASNITGVSTQPATLNKHDSISGSSLASEPRLLSKRIPSPSPLRGSTSKAIDIYKPAARTATAPLELFPASPSSPRSIPAQYNKIHPRTMTPNMTGDQLANAMVAGSLASSRAPSPKKQEPPPLPSRKAKHHHTFTFSRTPSPVKTGMRQTLRKTASDISDNEDDDMLHPYGKHKKKRLVRKHPNKHHEGDRKRWRDAVTERERKRYEGLWAANKGVHCSFSRDEEIMFRKVPSQKSQVQELLQDQVSNIVARDIWTRSRLPDSTLEAVWDLVDSDNVGRLGKEEFVVGMWLIDQRLRGRKLPVKVSDTVWASVRGLRGIKIRK